MTSQHCDGLEHGLFHIIMLATTGTDCQIFFKEVNLLVKSLILKKNVLLTCDGDANQAKCHTLLRKTVKNAGVIVRPMPILQMNYLVHIFVGAFKSSVLTVGTEHCDLNTKKTWQQMQQCATWAKKAQKRSGGLAASKEQFDLPN